MSLPAFLLRLLLCLTLVLNGSGYAVAATQMQLTHMATAEQEHLIATRAVHDAPAPCHSQVPAEKEAAPTMSQTPSSQGRPHRSTGRQTIARRCVPATASSTLRWRC